jgi:hypothetical protein
MMTRNRKNRKPHQNMLTDIENSDIENVFDDTIDEILCILLIIITFGLAYLIFAKRRTNKSIIHPFFKYIDFFDVAKTMPAEYYEL